MKDTAPKGLGIIAIAALFGIIAAGVAFVLFDFSAIASLFMGVVVGGIAAIFLLFGWREPAAGPMGVTDHQAKAAPTAPQQKAETPPAAKPVVTADPAPTPAPEPTPAPAAEEAPAIKSTLLAGEVELDAKKGDWKYDGSDDEAESAPVAAATPTFLKAAREGGPDDLKQIKGVGPKLEKTLHEMGLFHFDQISTWGPAEQAWMDENLAGFKGRATRDDWVGQAKVLAAGGTTEFSKKVDKGGVY